MTITLWSPDQVSPDARGGDRTGEREEGSRTRTRTYIPKSQFGLGTRASRESGSRWLLANGAETEPEPEPGCVSCRVVGVEGWLWGKHWERRLVEIAIFSPSNAVTLSHAALGWCAGEGWRDGMGWMIEGVTRSVCLT